MKKIMMVALLSAGLYKSNAQVMAAKAQNIVIKSANLRCWECKEKLDKYLVNENNSNMDNGMIKWTYNLLAGEIRINYLPDRVTPDVIRTALNNAGFDADSTKAEPDAYKTLPPICKRKEEGGGPQKGKPCHIQPY